MSLSGPLNASASLAKHDREGLSASILFPFGPYRGLNLTRKLECRCGRHFGWVSHQSPKNRNLKSLWRCLVDSRAFSPFSPSPCLQARRAPPIFSHRGQVRRSLPLRRLRRPLKCWRVSIAPSTLTSHSRSLSAIARSATSLSHQTVSSISCSQMRSRTVARQRR